MWVCELFLALVLLLRSGLFDVLHVCSVCVLPRSF